MRTLSPVSPFIPLITLPMLLAAGAHAAPVEALKPMAFLAGHCWKATFADGKTIDEHCFQWQYQGHVLRDVHTVRSPGRPDYVGETLYYYDSASAEVAFLYVENGGGYSRGNMIPDASGLDFPATDYVAAGKALRYRVRWTPTSEDSYLAHSEMQIDGKWITQFRLQLKKQ